MKTLLLPVAALVVVAPVLADSFVLPPQGESPFEDTEVSTNIALCALGDGAGFKVLDLTLSLSGTPTNCLQVAFGHDADGNGVLDFSETETVYGWRAGRLFAEDVRGWTRILSEPVSDTAARELRIHVESDSRFRARCVSLTCGGTPVFGELAASRPDWLLRRGWNMARVTRRGTGLPSEWVACERATLGLAVFIR